MSLRIALGWTPIHRIAVLAHLYGGAGRQLGSRQLGGELTGMPEEQADWEQDQ